MKRRIFTAIEIETQAKRSVLAYIKALKNEFPKYRIGWEKEEKIHLTLKFFGAIEFELVNDLIRIIEKVSANFSKFNLQISGTGIFPNQNKPGVLWLGILDEKENLANLNDLLEKEFSKIGFPPEKRKFNLETYALLSRY